MISIETLMETIRDDLNGYYYGVVNGYEIMYTHKEKWRLRPIKKNQLWRIFSHENAIETLNRHQIDLEKFQRDLYRVCMTKATYYISRLNTYEKLFGKEAIDKAVADFEDFGKRLGKLIGKEVKKKTFKLHKGEKS
jgi:hypothetical protein